MKFKLALILIVSFLNTAAFAKTQQKIEAKAHVDPAPVMPPAGLVPENFILLDASLSHPKHILIADKETRTLTVWQQGQAAPTLLGAFPMDIGKNHGDKITSGDHKTPEGIYFFQEKLEGPGLDFSQYGKRAYTMDYPNFFDQRAGKTGHGIWLHSVPDTQSLTRGSRGCVVVRNEINDKLLSLIQLKSTPVLILDRVNYIPPTEIKKRRAALEAWVDEWRKAWESKDLDNYMSYYDDTFYALKMNKNRWRRYKENLNQNYSYIKVNVKEPFLLVKREEAIISFIQDYSSDGLKDLGQKTLYVRKSAEGKYKILTEIWRPLSHDLVAEQESMSTAGKTN